MSLTIRPYRTVAALAEAIQQGDRRALAKALSLVESKRKQDIALTVELLERLYPRTGTAYRIGISGMPGVGKSTFVNAFGMYLIEQHRYTIAVLAIDPSSVRSGGSILGDKTRMWELARHPGAFIRPSPSSGMLGGIAPATREAVLLCEAAGFDVIFVETVGVGQTDTAIADIVDFVLLFLLANAGDELQGIKRGIMEIADAIIINKADGKLRSLAEQARRHLVSALRLLVPPTAPWKPPVLLCSAVEHTGFDEIWATIYRYFTDDATASLRQQRRREQQLRWFHQAIQQSLTHLFYSHPDIQPLLPEYEEKIRSQQLLPLKGAYELLQRFQTSL